MRRAYRKVGENLDRVAGWIADVLVSLLHSSCEHHGDVDKAVLGCWRACDGGGAMR